MSIFSQDLLELINDYRVDNGLLKVESCSNLELASNDHLLYLIESNNISHSGENGSNVQLRCIDAKASGFLFGEIIGYSDNIDQLFLEWRNSPTHNTVLLSDKWKWVGISKKIKGHTVVSVINFSSGLLGSLEVESGNENIIIRAKYVGFPIFTGDFTIIQKALEENKLEITIKPDRIPLFIYVKDPDNVLVNQIDIFSDNLF